MTGDAHEQFLGHFQNTVVNSNWEKSCEVFLSSNSQMLFLLSFGGNITVFPFVFWCSLLFILLSYNLFCLGCRPLPSTLGSFLLFSDIGCTRLDLEQPFLSGTQIPLNLYVLLFRVFIFPFIQLWPRAMGILNYKSFRKNYLEFYLLYCYFRDQVPGSLVSQINSFFSFTG